MNCVDHPLCLLPLREVGLDPLTQGDPSLALLSDP
jgi:hypothetical protein